VYGRPDAGRNRTWGRYRRYELSETIEGYRRRFEAMRQREIAVK